MMNKIFTFMILCGALFSVFTGRVNEVSQAILNQGSEAVSLAISLMGSFCLWGGVMKVADCAGLTGKLAALFSPIFSLIFKGIDSRSEAMKSISTSAAANLLGLGNAATPLGIAAMKQLKKQERCGDRASDNMIAFVVMNTASMQLIPTTTAALRASLGSGAPLDILPAVWIASSISLLVGLTAAKLGGIRR